MMAAGETLPTACLATDVELSGGFVRLAGSFINPETMHPPIRTLSSPLRSPQVNLAVKPDSWYGIFVARLWEIK